MDSHNSRQRQRQTFTHLGLACVVLYVYNYVYRAVLHMCAYRSVWIVSASKAYTLRIQSLKS